MPPDLLTAPLATEHGDTDASHDGGARVLTKGALVGRYVVLERLGSGGAGSVHAAYDTQLDRRVALKVLHDGDDLGSFDTESKTWKAVVREARILGRLNHPNVVTVYDVGVEDGVPFIAMELVEGPDLAQWLAGQDPQTQQREIVERFAQAARGMAAAHGAGIVHGDFKPSNCLIGQDGRVRVSDFGLARGKACSGETPDPFVSDKDGSDRSAEASSEADADETLPQQVGTPYFMAPEQHLGERPTAASDVFSFCLALADALGGKSLLQSTNLTGLAVEKLEEDLPARLSDAVPRSLRPLLADGLRIEAKDRPTSMEPVADALQKIRTSSRRRRWGAVAVAAAAIGGTAAGWYGAAAGGEPDPCERAGTSVAEVWSSPRQEALASALESGEGGSTWTAVEAPMNAFVEGWTAQRREACEAHSAGIQSAELLDRRNLCLDRKLSRFNATLRVLEGGDPEVLARAGDLAQGLPTLDRCADAEALLAEVPWPEDPDLRAEIDEVYDALAEAEVLSFAGKTQRANDLAKPLAERARAVGFDPLITDVLMGLGGTQIHLSQAETAYETILEAHYAAIRGRYDRGVAESATDLMFLALHHGRLDESALWGKTAEAHLTRVDDPSHELRLHRNRGHLAREQGKYDDAKAHFEKAVQMQIAMDGPESDGLGSLYASLGDLAVQMNEYEMAVDYLERSRANKLAHLEADHPSHAVTSMTLGIAHFEHGRYAEAEAEHRRAIEEFQSGLGMEHPVVGEALLNLANALGESRQFEKAKTTYQRSYELFVKTMGAESQEAGMALLFVGKTDLDLKRPEEALPTIERARDVLAAAMEPDHPYVVDANEAIGTAYLDLERYADALAVFEKTLAADRTAKVPDPRTTAYALVNFGRAQFGLGKYDEAARVFEEAVQIREREDIDGRPLADAYSWLAQARWAQGRPDEARGLMKQARDVHLRIDDPAGVRDTDAWLAAH